MQYQIDIKTFDKLLAIELFEAYKLRTDVFVVEQNCAYPEVDDIDLKAWHLFVWHENALIGYLRIYYSDENTMDLGRIVVREQERGKGVAFLMMTYALDWIQKKHDPKVVNLSAQTHLELFYKSFGFKTVSEPYPDYGIMHLDMKKTL